MLGGSTISQHVNRGRVDVVIPILRRLFFQTVDQHLQIRLGETADELIRRCVIEIDHVTLACKMRCRLRPHRATRAAGFVRALKKSGTRNV